MKLKELINKIKFVNSFEAEELIINLKTKNYVVFIGLHGVSEYLYNNEYKFSVDNAKYIFCDSIFVQFLFFIFNGKIPNKSPGPDVISLIINRALLYNDELSFFGGNKKIITEKLNKNSFNKFEIIEPGYINHNNIKDCNESKKILNLKSKYILIAISCPKQEIIANYHYSSMPNSIIIPVGAAINFYFEIEKRAPLIFRKLGIEFLWRLFFSPKKISIRIIYALYKIIYSTIFRK